MGLGEEFYRYGSRGGEVADKDQGVCKVCTPLIWPQMVLPMSFEVSLKLLPFGWAFTSKEDLKDIDIFVI